MKISRYRPELNIKVARRLIMAKKNITLNNFWFSVVYYDKDSNTKLGSLSLRRDSINSVAVDYIKEDGVSYYGIRILHDVQTTNLVLDEMGCDEFNKWLLGSSLR